MHPIALLKRRREIRPSLLLPSLRRFPIGGVEIVCYVLCKNTGLEKMSTVGRKRGAGAWGGDKLVWETRLKVVSAPESPALDTEPKTPEIQRNVLLIADSRYTFLEISMTNAMKV